MSDFMHVDDAPQGGMEVDAEEMGQEEVPNFPAISAQAMVSPLMSVAVKSYQLSYLLYLMYLPLHAIDEYIFSL
ncbi:hypothetical protein EON65_12470 [archaeon]|nr:MAG: hypothetical protein EON65_12470 [archaeon]